MPRKPKAAPTAQQLAHTAERRQDAAYIHLARVMLKKARAKPKKMGSGGKAST